MSNVTTTHGAGHNEVLYEIEDGAIALITLNAPERMNTISRDMLGELTRLLVKANEPGSSAQRTEMSSAD